MDDEKTKPFPLLYMVKDIFVASGNETK
jgi:hypothetical protein